MEQSGNFELSGQQLAAKEQIEVWFTNLREGKPENLIFRLFGYAGTGKTTTIRKLIADLELRMGYDVFFGAYTGKAAMVMRKQGLPARTIHSLIYKPVMPIRSECEKLKEAWHAEEEEGEKKRKKQEYDNACKVRFVLRNNEDPSDLDNAELLVLDECSMVNDDMLADIKTFGVPLLVLGDPGQLPPIEGEGALTREKPDIMLTQIHRQAEGDPIIDYSIRARNGVYIPYMSHGKSGHYHKHQIEDVKILEYDQILTGKNVTRQTLNQDIRKLRGYESPYPMVGEKLICLKNDPEHGLFNGMMCECVGVGDILSTYIELEIKRETDLEDYPPMKVNALLAHFDRYYDKDALDKVPWWDKKGTNEFDYGYAITVHKAQGSQWDNVCLYDDKFLAGWKKEERKRWMYTAITRAIEGIHIVD